MICFLTVWDSCFPIAHQKFCSSQPNFVRKILFDKTGSKIPKLKGKHLREMATARCFIMYLLEGFGHIDNLQTRSTGLFAFLKCIFWDHTPPCSNINLHKIFLVVFTIEWLHIFLCGILSLFISDDHYLLLSEHRWIY